MDAHDELEGFDPEPDPFDDEEDADEELSYRSIGIAIFIGILLLTGGLILLNSGSPSGTLAADTMGTRSARRSGARNRLPKGGMLPPPIILSRMKLLDTVYTTDSLYLDVNLVRQNVTVRYRDGRTRTFLLSSGNPAISGGIATPAGLFTIQNMVPMALSKQFNNARLHHWIGIQGGVGFHGLDGDGYYGNLGVRPSSHGCVRMSREEINEMYSLVHPGAMITVHYDNPARVVAFCNPEDTAGAIVIDSAAVFNKHLGRERLASLYEGSYWSKPQPPLVHLAGQRLRWGMDLGDVRRVARQTIPTQSFLPDPSELRTSSRMDNAVPPPLGERALRSLAAASDSLRAAERKMLSVDDKNVEYGE